MYQSPQGTYEPMDMGSYPLQHDAYGTQGAIGPSQIPQSAHHGPPHKSSTTSKRRSVASHRTAQNAPVPPARTSSLAARAAAPVDPGVPSVQVIQPTPTKNRKKKHGRQVEEASPTLRSYQLPMPGSEQRGLEVLAAGGRDESDAELSTVGTSMLEEDDALDGLSIGMDYNSEEELAREAEEARRARAREKGRERQRRKRERDKAKAAESGAATRASARDGGLSLSLGALTTSASLGLSTRVPSNPNVLSQPSAHAGPSSASTSYSPLPFSASYPNLSPGDFLSTGSTSVSGQSSPNALFSPHITTPGGAYPDATPGTWDPASSSTSLLEMGLAAGQNKRASRPRRGRANSSSASGPSRRISPAALPLFQPLANPADVPAQAAKSAPQRSSKRRKSEPEPDGFSRSLHSAQTQAQAHAHGQAQIPVGLGVMLPTEMNMQSASLPNSGASTALPSATTSPADFGAGISPLTHAPWTMVDPSHPHTGVFAMSSSQPVPARAPFFVPIHHATMQPQPESQPQRPRPRRAASDSASFVLSDNRHTGVTTPEAAFSTSGPTSAGWSSPPTPPPVPGLPKQYHQQTPLTFDFASSDVGAMASAGGGTAGLDKMSEPHNFSLGPAFPSVPHGVPRPTTPSAAANRFASILTSVWNDQQARNALQSELGVSHTDLQEMQAGLADVYEQWVAAKAVSQTPAHPASGLQQAGLSGTLERGMSQVSLEGHGTATRSQGQSSTTSPPSATTATSLTQFPSVPGSPTHAGQNTDSGSFFTPAKQQQPRRQPQTVHAVPTYGAYAHPYMPVRSQDPNQSYQYTNVPEHEALQHGAKQDQQPMTATATGSVQVGTSGATNSAGGKAKTAKPGKKTHGRNRSLSSNSLLSRGLVINSQTPWPYPPSFAANLAHTSIAPPDTPHDGGRSSTVSPSTVQTPSTGNATAHSFAEMQMTAGSHAHAHGQAGGNPAGGDERDVEMDHSSWVHAEHAPRYGSATEPTHLSRSYTQPDLMSMGGQYAGYSHMGMATGLLAQQGQMDMDRSAGDAAAVQGQNGDQARSVGLDSPLNMTHSRPAYKTDAHKPKDSDMPPPTEHAMPSHPYATTHTHAHAYGDPHAQAQAQGHVHPHGMVYTTPSHRPARQMQPYTPPTPMPVRGHAGMLGHAQGHAHALSTDTSGHPGLYFSGQHGAAALGGHGAGKTAQEEMQRGGGAEDEAGLGQGQGQGEPGMEVDMSWMEGQNA